MDGLGRLLVNMCLCTERYSCELCVIGGLCQMVSNMLEPDSDSKLFHVVSVMHPSTNELVQCDARRCGRFTVIELPENFLDTSDAPDPSLVPLPASPSSNHPDDSASSSDPSGDSITSIGTPPARKLFPLFNPKFPQRNPAPRSRKLSFKKQKTQKNQAQMDRTRSSSSSLKKQACIQAYFSQKVDEPIRSLPHNDPSV